MMDIIIDDDDDFAEAVGIIMQGDDWSSSDKDDIPQYAPANVWGRGASVVSKAPNLDRQCVYFSHLLFNDFWGPSPNYDKYFKKFFKMPIVLFDMIVADVVADDDYFRRKPDACGRLGLKSLQKLCCALRQLTSGVAANELDDKYRMHDLTGLQSMKRFCNSIIRRVYGDTSFCHPNASDMDRLLDKGNSAGFPGCIGSIDCMHWEWKNCLTRWKGMFQGKSGVATVILEAIADAKCHFWNFNFGAPGTFLNDINVLDRSPLFDMAVRGESPSVKFTVNGNDCKNAYWFADGIYPRYACFAKTFPRPVTRMQKLFAVAQESKRKDIERAFGIL